MICYDAGFPEVARTLALKGAKIIFMPSAWRIEDKYMWDLNTQSRGLENTTFISAVNICGYQGETFLFGNSKVVSPSGIVLNQCEKTENLLFTTIDLEDINTVRENIMYLDDRNTNLYR